jgi:subtilisin family serine protease
VAPDAKILSAKVLGDDGSGTEQSVATGIDWLLERGADIISMSLGSPLPSAAMKAAIDRAVAAGKFVICAAGNDGRPNSINYPAKWPNAIAVGAVDREGRVARFSSQGSELAIAAPGEDILSTFTGGGYAKLSGTSMSTPFVSGVVALLLARNRQPDCRSPVVDQASLVEHLRRTATDAGTTGRDPAYGWGLINPDSMLQEVTCPVPGQPGPEPPLPELSIPCRLNGREASLVLVAGP